VLSDLVEFVVAAEGNYDLASPASVVRDLDPHA